MKEKHEEEKNVAVSMEQFFTRQAANAGRKVRLSTPDGKETNEYLVILGADADAFRKAEAEYRRKILESVQKNREAGVENTDETVPDYRIDLLASLVVGWSFPEACSAENVKKLLREAPQIADEIDRIANNRKVFFKLPSVT